MTSKGSDQTAHTLLGAHTTLLEISCTGSNVRISAMCLMKWCFYFSAAGLDKDAGFTETTSDSECTEYSSHDCEKY